MTTSPIHPDVLGQLKEISIPRDRPLVICDADEVLLTFMADFENFLHGRALYFAWGTYALNGNVRMRSSHAPVPASEIRNLLEEFYTERGARMGAVPRAAEFLALLDRHTTIVVLTNLALEHRAARIEALSRHGLDYPVIANQGDKGPAIERMTAALDAPAFFIDDSPRNHTSAAKHAAKVVRIQLVAERRLSAIVGHATDCHFRTDSWHAVHHLVTRHLEGHAA